MLPIISLPLDTSTPPSFQGCRCKYPRASVIGFRITYSFFHSPTSGNSISKGAIAGIVVGIVLGVVVFPILGFVLWRRQRRRGDRKDTTFIEPCAHKRFNIAEVLDIQSNNQGQRGKSPTLSPDSGVSLDLFPVTIPQIINPQPKHSPPTFPRSPTTSPLSPIHHLYDSSGGDVGRSPETVDQYPSVQIRNTLQANSESTPFTGLNRRSTVPKPSGPRPPSYRYSIDDPSTSVIMPLAQTSMDPTPTEGKEQPESEMQQVNEGERTTIYSFLDMNSSSAPPSTIDGVGQSPSPNQPTSPTNLDSPRHSLVTGTDSTRSHPDPDKRRESGMSKPLSLSVVIQPPTSKYPPSTERHPYSRHSTGYRLTPHSHRPRTGERISPTESIPFTTSEISEIRFSHPGEPSASRPGSGSGPQPPPLRATTATSPIYRKLFGTLQGEILPDGLLAKKRPSHRKALSTSTFNTWT